MMKRFVGVGVVLGLMVFATISRAQSQCTAIMEQAIELVSATCSGTGRNEVCHGYFRVEAKDGSGQPTLQFNVGDMLPIDQVSALTTSPLNPTTGDWGVALMRVQANLSDLLPGQNATFLLLGDTRLEADQTIENARPLQIFRLETGLTGVSCSGAPTNGLLIQSPSGAQEVKLTIDGVTLQTTGTAFVQAEAGQAMTVTVIEGSALVTAGTSSQLAEAGTQVRVALDEALNPASDVSVPVAVQPASISELPFTILPRDVDSPILSAFQPRDGTSSASETQTPPETTTTQAQILNISSATSQASATAVNSVSSQSPTLQSAGLGVDLGQTFLYFVLFILISLFIILLLVFIGMIVRGISRAARQLSDK